MHLLNIVGPPASGKMTVGRAVCELTGFRLFHNHMSIEPLLGVFEFGTPSFQRLTTLIRRSVVAEAVEADLTGLVFSYVWNFDSPQDREEVERLIAPVVDAGHPVDFVELVAPQHVRLAREGGSDRIDHKRSKRDVEWARSHVIELEQHSRFSTDDASPHTAWPLTQYPHVRLDNAHGDPRATAERVVDVLGLPRRAS